MIAQARLLFGTEDLVGVWALWAISMSGSRNCVLLSWPDSIPYLLPLVIPSNKSQAVSIAMRLSSPLSSQQIPPLPLHQIISHPPLSPCPCPPPSPPAPHPSSSPSPSHPPTSPNAPPSPPTPSPSSPSARLYISISIHHTSLASDLHSSLRYPFFLFTTF